MKNDTIGWFDGTAYDFLSNFHVHPVVTPFGVFRTGEHYFQWHKAVSLPDKELIRNAPTASLAKRYGRSIPLRKNWEKNRELFMASVLSAKFADPYLRDKLLHTGPFKLVEGNSWHDNIWGDCECSQCANIVGLNYLGQLLMDLRKAFLS